ncbi:unnamed protein product [Lymnaea stagnalis]|uniref:Ig-like domain-containing protein n=1 Tax=Lymnaea stagnalis TaxID=6523 RepID=A0AAV2H704_LYMST
MLLLVLLHVYVFVTTALCKTCPINASTRVTIECDVSNLNTTHIEWRAYNNVTHESLTLYTCEMTNCSTVTPLLNSTLEVTIEEGQGNVMFSVLVVPRTSLYFNEYNQYRCVAGMGDLSVCDTPNIYGDVISPTCDVPVLNSSVVSVHCRALTHFHPHDFDFLVKTNSRYNSNVTKEYNEAYSPSPIDSVQYYAVNYTLDTDINSLGPGRHEFILDVHSTSFGGTIASAFLNVIPQPINPECDYPVLSDSSEQLLVRCTTLLVSPQLVCEFIVRTDDLLVNVTGDVSYSTPFDQNAPGYLSACTLHVNISQLGPGSHEFQVGMHTNSSNDNSTRVAGAFTSPYVLSLPIARFDDRCIERVESLYGKYWSTMNCYCILGSPGNPKGDVVWYVNNESVWGNVIFAVFQDFVNNITYECRPTSPLQGNLPGVQLKIEVPRTPYIASFTANSTSTNITAVVNTTISFRCDADGFPTPLIFFGKNNSETTQIGSGRIIARHINGCMDAGGYCCRVRNETNVFITKQCISVFVKCPLVAQNYDTINVTSFAGKDAVVTIPVTGYPGPTLYVLKRMDEQQEVIDPTRYKVTFMTETPPYGEVDLTLRTLQEADFSKFTLEFGNGLGSNETTSFFLVKGKSGGGSNVEIRNIALGVAGGLVAVAVAVVIAVVLVKRGSCSTRKRTANYDTNRFTQMY